MQKLSNTTHINSVEYKELEKYKKIKKIGDDFETFFISFLLNNISKNIGSSGYLPLTTEGKIYRSWFYDAIAKEIAKSYDFHISENIQKELSEIEKLDYNKLRELERKKFLDIEIIPRKNFSINENVLYSHIENVIERVSKKYGIRKSLIKAIIKVESNFNPYAISSKGAKGLMQLMDSTAKDLGVKNVWSIVDNIEGGVKYLRSLIDRFGDEKLALAAYNAGPGNVIKYGNRIPPFRETQNYVNKVLYWDKYYKEKENETREFAGD